MTNFESTLIEAMGKLTAQLHQNGDMHKDKMLDHFSKYVEPSVIAEIRSAAENALIDAYNKANIPSTGTPPDPPMP